MSAKRDEPCSPGVVIVVAAAVRHLVAWVAHILRLISSSSNSFSPLKFPKFSGKKLFSGTKPAHRRRRHGTYLVNLEPRENTMRFLGPSVDYIVTSALLALLRCSCTVFWTLVDRFKLPTVYCSYSYLETLIMALNALLGLLSPVRPLCGRYCDLCT